MVEKAAAIFEAAQIAEKIIMGGYGFAITASIEVVEDRDCVCPLSEAKAIVITEEGTGRCCIYPYKDVDRANKISAPWSSCHVVYDMAGTEYRAGGAGFARQTCRKNGLNWLFNRKDGMEKSEMGGTRCTLFDGGSKDQHEQMLKSSQYLKAEGRELYLFMQTDGNLVLYPSTDQSPRNYIWASVTYGKGRAPHHLIMQKDGNLVIYDADRKPTWATMTNGAGQGCRFVVQDDGNLVIYDRNGRAIWASGTDGA